MTHQLFLIAPGEETTEDLVLRLKAILESVTISAVLIRRGHATQVTYEERVRILAPIAQERGAAVLLEDTPELVIPLGADGVHMTGGIGAVREAVALLKPDHIVGSGAIGSRHEAMLRGELEIDYLMFGDRPGAQDAGAEMAAWWSETFEIPCVYCAESPDDPAIAGTGAEFIGFSHPAVWSDPHILAPLGATP